MRDYQASSAVRDAYDRLKAAFPTIEFARLGITTVSSRSDELIMLPTGEAVARRNHDDYDLNYLAYEYYDQATLKELLADIVKDKEDALVRLEKRRKTLQADLERVRAAQQTMR